LLEMTEYDSIVIISFVAVALIFGFAIAFRNRGFPKGKIEP